MFGIERAMLPVKGFCCLLIFGAVVCQNGGSQPMIEGSGGSGEIDSGSTLDATVITTIIKTFPNSIEDTIDEVGSGDDEDRYVTNSTKLTKITTEATTTPRPIDEGEGSGVSGYGSGDEAGKGPFTSEVLKSSASPKAVLVKTVEDVSTHEETTQSSEESTKEAQTTESSLVSSKAADTKKPYTKVKTVEADPMTDIEVINSPTVNTQKSTAEKITTMGNDIPMPTENPSHVGNAAKSHGNKKSGQAISFTTGIIIGVVVGALLAVLVILLLVYRLRKKDEGSYSLDEPITGYTKQEPGSPVSGKEYLA